MSGVTNRDSIKYEIVFQVQKRTVDLLPNNLLVEIEYTLGVWPLALPADLSVDPKRVDKVADVLPYHHSSSRLNCMNLVAKATGSAQLVAQ